MLALTISIAKHEERLHKLEASIGMRVHRNGTRPESHGYAVRCICGSDFIRWLNIMPSPTIGDFHFLQRPNAKEEKCTNQNGEQYALSHWDFDFRRRKKLVYPSWTMSGLCARSIGNCTAIRLHSAKNTIRFVAGRRYCSKTRFYFVSHWGRCRCFVFSLFFLCSVSTLRRCIQNTQVRMCNSLICVLLRNDDDDDGCSIIIFPQKFRHKLIK